jgi:cysteine desulfurase/selenocysteine lyase
LLDNHSEIRKLFPFTQNRIYLDAAHYVPYSKRVADKLNSFIDSFIKGNIHLGKFQLDQADELRQTCGKLINAPQEDIIITSNTTHGINIFANGVNLLPDNNNVAFLNTEFPAVVYPWLNQEKLGRVNVYMIPSDKGYANETLIKKSLLEYNIRVLTISYVQFLGYRYNIRNLADFCRKHEIFLLVDAIQAAGVNPINTELMGIDYICAGNQKWMMSPAGTGFTYISKKYQQYINPTYVSTINIKYDFENFLDYKLNFKDGGAAYENSTPNTLGMLGMNEALCHFMELGVENIFNHIIELQNAFIELLDRTKYRVESDLTPEHRSNILIFSSLDQTQNKEIQKSLEEKMIFIALREGFLRLSPHIYNNLEDIENLTKELNSF